MTTNTARCWTCFSLAWLLDTSTVAYGDVAYDCGGLLASLERLALLRPPPKDAEALLLDEYRARVETDADRQRRVHYYAALSHLRRALRAGGAGHGGLTPLEVALLHFDALSN